MRATIVALFAAGAIATPGYYPGKPEGTVTQTTVSLDLSSTIRIMLLTRK